MYESFSDHLENIGVLTAARAVTPDIDAEFNTYGMVAE